MNFLDFNVSFRRQSKILRFRFDNNKNRIWSESFQLFIDSDIILGKLRSSVIPTNNLFLSSYFVKHPVHAFEIIHVQEPCTFVLFIFVERNGETVSDIQSFVTFHGTEKNTDDSLHILSLTHTVKVINNTQENQWMNNDLKSQILYGNNTKFHIQNKTYLLDRKIQMNRAGTMSSSDFSSDISVNCRRSSFLSSFFLIVRSHLELF